jgi:hypothetical protein
MMTLLFLTISALNKLNPEMTVADLPTMKIPENQQEGLGGYGWINTNMRQRVMGAKKKYQKIIILNKTVLALQDKEDMEMKQFWTFRRMA